MNLQIETLTDLLDSAVTYAKKDGKTWSTGYTALRSIAAVCGIDSDEWSHKRHAGTYLDERGIRRGALDYDLLVNDIKSKLEKTFFPNGGTHEEISDFNRFMRQRLWKGKYFY